MSGFTLSALKNTVDELRSQYYPKNETEKKVYEALSSKNWGASSTLLNEIAAESMDYEKYKIMTNIIWQFLDTDGRTWKQIFKNLTLIEFLIKNGSERFIEECRDKLYKIRALQDFNFYEGTIEKASGIREKSRQIVELLGSNDMIRSERDKARQLRNKFVGIDSRNAGFGGYSGSDSYYGGGNSYSAAGGRDYGGSSSYGGGRYSDSYDAPNRRASESHTGRYGGGAYDSGRPPRYGDEVHEDRQSFRDESHEARPNTSRYTDHDAVEEPVPKSTPHKSKSISGPSTGGKLKVNIKKTSEPVHHKPAPVAEKNLLDTSEDLMGGPVGGGVPGSESFDGFTSASSFDPFGNHTAPAQGGGHGAASFDPFGNSAPVTTTNAASFDPFGAAPPVAAAPAAQPAPVFDPFAAAPAAPVPPPNTFPYGAQPMPSSTGFPAMNYQGNFPPAAAPQPFPNNSFSSVPVNANPAPNPAAMNSYNANAGNQFAQPAQPQTNAFPTSPTAKAGNMGTFSHDAEFGDFEGPAQSQTGAKPANTVADKWGDLGKLVDLNKIEKNAELQAKQASANNNQNYSNSFAGLDGFSKTPQSMQTATNAVRPIGSYANAQPMNAMGAPRPMGGGLAPNYGVPPMGMGVPNPGMPGYGAPPMGAPMGQPNYGAGNYGGYPNQNPGFGGAPPMGNPGYGAPPNVMMGGNPGMYGAPPNPNYGNPQGFGMPPRGW